MTKRAVMLRFAALSAMVLAVGAGAGALVHAQVNTWAGWCVVATAVVVVALTAWACFTPNARLFGAVIDGRGVRRRAFAITFDDGPSADITPRILDTLAEHGVRATFFVLGQHAERHPDVVDRIRKEGHELASHGLDHSLLTFAGGDEVTRQLQETELIVEHATGSAPARLFRAPHGFRNPFVGRAAGRRGYRVVGWTKGVFDTALPGVDAIVRRSLNGLRPGAILLLHDADGSGRGADRSQTAEALPQILQAASSAGYEPVTVSELAAEAHARRGHLLRLGFGVVLAVGVVALALKRLHLGIVEHGVDIEWWWVLAALAANLVSILTKATTWKAALDAVPGRSRVGYRDVVPALFIGFLLNTILFARVGEVARVAVLRRRLRRASSDFPVSTIAGTVLAEQVALGVALAVILVAMAVALPVPSLAKRLVAAFVALLFLIGLALAGLEAFSRYRRRQHRDEIDYAHAWWDAARLQLESLAHGLARGQQIWRDRRQALIAVCSGLCSWMAQIVGIHWALHAFGIRLGLSAAALVFFASTLAQLFPILPGNLGIFQGAVVLPLTTTFGVETSRAVQFSVGLQLIEAVLGVGLGFWFLWREGLSIAEARTLTDDTPSEQAAADEDDRVTVPGR